MIKEPAAIGVAERPALRVGDKTRLVLFSRNVPKLFQADAKNLWLAVLCQVEVLDQLLRKMAPHPFGKESVFGVQFQARLPAVFLAAIPRDTHVAGRNALDAAILVPQDFSGGKARKDLYTQRFGLPRQPAAQIAQRNSVAALVVHERRHQAVRELCLASFGKNPMVIFRHGYRHRAVHRAPIRQQFIECPGVDHGTRQNVCAYFRALFKNADRQFQALFSGDLFGTDRCRKAGGTTTNNHQIIGHRFTCRHGFAFSSPPGTARLPI